MRRFFMMENDIDGGGKSVETHIILFQINYELVNRLPSL